MPLCEPFSPSSGSVRTVSGPSSARVWRGRTVDQSKVILLRANANGVDENVALVPGDLQACHHAEQVSRAV